MRPIENESLIISTIGRADDVQVTFEALMRCVYLPEQIIVTEAKKNDTFIRDFIENTANDFRKRGIDVVHRYSAKGASRQRNYGVSLCRPEIKILHFIDDDLSPASYYFEEISRHYEMHPECVAAGGFLEPQNRSSNKIPLVKKLFLLDSTHPGRYLISGQTSQFQHFKELTGENFVNVDWLSGCCMSFRKSVFDLTKFDESFKNESYDEDLDISVRAKKYGQVHVIPAARAEHRLSEEFRISPEAMWHQKIKNRHVIHKKNYSSVYRIFWWWGCLGAYLSLLAHGPPAEPQRRGFRRAVSEILIPSKSE